MNKVYPTLFAAGVICLFPPSALAAEDAALKQQELSHAIQRQILTLNVNQVEKFIIDFHFSTFHGMYAYRELMQWAQASASPPAQQDDLMAMIRAGMAAIIHSGMGLPIVAWKGDAPPIGLLFNLGLPRYIAKADFSQASTLKWNPATFDQQVSPESIGQSLAAKSLFILTDASTEGKALGKTLLSSALQEFQDLIPLLELGGSKGASYMPGLVKLEKGKWSVINTNSHLYGQMALIQGLASLHAVLLLPALENESIQGKRASEWRKEIRRSLDKVYHTTIKLHFDSKSGSFASTYTVQSGNGNRLAAEDAGYALEVLASLVDALPQSDPLHEIALKHLDAQAGYLSARMAGKESAPKVFLLQNNQIFGGLLLRLEDQLSIMNGLLAAEQATGNANYGKIAQAVFHNARNTLWSAPAGIFRSAAGQTVSPYDGRLFGMSLALWRRLAKSLPPGEAQGHAGHLIEVVLKRGGLQQAENHTTGETKSPETFIRDDLPQLISSIATLKKEEQSEKITAAIDTLSDQDNDGIPGYRFAGGHFGAAPVLVIQTGIKTPFDPPAPATNPTGSTP